MYKLFGSLNFEAQLRSVKATHINTLYVWFPLLSETQNASGANGQDTCCNLRRRTVTSSTARQSFGGRDAECEVLPMKILGQSAIGLQNSEPYTDKDRPR